MLDARTIGSLNDSRRYGEVRLYGALSFGLLVLLTGWLIDKSNNGSYEKNEQGETTEGVYINGFKYVFYLHFVLSLIGGLVGIDGLLSGATCKASVGNATSVSGTSVWHASPAYHPRICRQRGLGVLQESG